MPIPESRILFPGFVVETKFYKPYMTLHEK